MDSARSGFLSPEQQIESSVSISLSTPLKENLNDSTDTAHFPSEDLPDLDENGLLDWSDKKLVKSLPREKCAELIKLKRNILRLNVSRNSLRSIDCSLLPLEKCYEIDTSQNELTQLQQFLQLIQTLKKLNLSDNRINSLGCLDTFVNLQWLNFSHNRIENLPKLDQLHNLSTLILNCNRLRAIPNLSKLEALTELGLHGNLIRSFENIHTLIPSQNLRILDLGGNLISDLCEINYLRGFTNLESLTVLGNNFASPDGCKFSYRPFVYSCILGELKILDGVCLSEGEVLKGEWLHSNRKTRSFRPGSGSHAQLCAFLLLECPLVSKELPIEGVNDDRLKKIIQKRREYKDNHLHHHSTPSLTYGKRQQFMSTTVSPISRFNTTPRGGTILKNINFSPPSSPRNKIEEKSTTTKNWRVNTVVSSNKEQKLTEDSANFTPTTISVALSQTPKTARKDEDLNINGQLKTTTSQTKTTSVDDTIPQQPQQPPKDFPQIGIPRSASIHPSPNPRSFNIVRNATFSHPSPKLSNNLKTSENIKVPLLGKATEKKKTKAVGCFRSVLAQKLRRRSTAPMQQQPTTTNSEQTRNQLLQKRVDKLNEQNNMLFEIGEENVKTLQQLAGRLEQVESALTTQINQNRTLCDLLLPTPTHLTTKKMVGTNSVLVSWENVIPILNAIDHYDVFVNEKQVGKVVARNKRLLITDTNLNEDIRVSVQACFSKLNNARSQKAEIILHATEEDEKREEDSPDEKENEKERIS
uniref:Uncharacterized protein n=1 Tax=Meloidogyne javanica TaxID=6303 RepID=A0A915N575_MELJA